MITDDQIITELIEREGGFVDNPADKGGPTKFGVTLKTLARHRRVDPAGLTAVDVEKLSIAQARDIYRTLFLVDTGALLLVSAELRAVFVDCCVLHGEKNATRMLQRAIRATDDGVLGPLTAKAANALIGSTCALRMLAERARFFGRLISKDLTDKDRDGIPDNTEFAAGWLSHRLAAFIEELA